MSVQRWGLIVQGPRFSNGYKGESGDVVDSPNPVPGIGWDSQQSMEATLLNSSNFFDRAIISTWEGEAFQIPSWCKHCDIIFSKPPIRDFDNRRKQFASTLAGLEFLEAAEITHVLKVRADQVISNEVFSWVRESSSELDAKSGKILCSDYLDEELFYVGDFFWGGEIGRLREFVTNVLSYGEEILHPVIGVDYTLKHLIKTDLNLTTNFTPGHALDLQIARSWNRGLADWWIQNRDAHFGFPSAELLDSIQWRGRLLSEVLDTGRFNKTNERFREDLFSRSQRPLIMERIKRRLIVSKQRARFDRTMKPNSLQVRIRKVVNTFTKRGQ